MGTIPDPRRSLPGTTVANLDCGIVTNTVVLIEPKFGGIGIGPP